MALVVQTYPSVTAGANGYVSVAYLKAYLDDRLRDYSAKTDPQLAAAIIAATSYIDTRYRYIGYRLEAGQSTEWPRQNAWDDRGDKVDGVPDAVKAACCEYAWRALSGELMADPERDPSGQAVLSKSESVGPISSSVSYAARGTELPTYPAADRILMARGLVFSGGSSGLGVMNVSRGS